MFNNSLFDKETRLKIAEREQEAERFRLHNQLGYRDRQSMGWVFGFVTLIAMVVLGMMML